jgi:hypothetical protein
MIVVLSGTSAGAASTTFGGSAPDGNAVAAIDAFAGAEAVTAAPASALTAAGGGGGAIAGLGAAAFGDEAVIETDAAGEDAAGAGAAAFAAGAVAGWFCGSAREGARTDLADVPGLSLGGVAATEAGGDAGFVGAAIVAGTAVVTGAAGAADGTAAARTLVTIARAATGTFSGSLGRSTSESTTPAPAVAPIAVATRTTRAVRAKLGAGAK